MKDFLRIILKRTTILILSSMAAVILSPKKIVAGNLYLKMGPAATGNGGSNPLSIPPSSLDLEFSYLTDGKWETSLAVCPGLTLGKRAQSGNFYLGYGGGLIIDGNGAGLGPYTSFGWEAGTKFKFGAEYKQAIGLTSAGMISPYAARMLFGYTF